MPQKSLQASCGTRRIHHAIALTAVGLSVLLTASGASAAPVQWGVAAGGNGHWYERIDVGGTITWYAANTEAEQSSFSGTSGHLVTITSAEENGFVMPSLMGSAPKGTPDDGKTYWIGGFQPEGSPEPGGNWQWVSGETWSYSFWGPGEPNNAGSENHLCYLAAAAYGFELRPFRVPSRPVGRPGGRSSILARRC